MNDQQDTDPTEGLTAEPDRLDPDAEREPVTHSLKGSVTIDLNTNREEDNDG